MYPSDSKISNALFGSKPFAPFPSEPDYMLDPKSTDPVEQAAVYAWAAHRSALLAVREAAKSVQTYATEAVENVEHMLDGEPSYGVPDAGLRQKGQDFALACGRAVATRDALSHAIGTLTTSRESAAVTG